MTILRCLLCILFFAANAHAGEIVSFDQSNPPFMYEQNGTAKGLYPDIIGETFRRMRLPVVLQSLPWSRAVGGAERGDWGLAGLYRTVQREEIFDFSVPLYDEVLCVFVRKGGEFSFEGVEDLDGKLVGVLRGWSYGDAFDRAVRDGRLTVEAVNFDRINVIRLLAGRVDAILMMPECFAMIRREVDPAEQLIALPVPLAVNRTYLGFAKSTHRRAVLEQFDAALASMKHDGTFERIVRDNLRYKAGK